MNIQKIIYKEKPSQFSKVLTSRIQKYFESNQLDKYAPPKMQRKILLLFAVWVAIYAVMLTIDFSFFGLLGITILFHTTLFQLALVAHDGSHQAASSDAGINKLVYKIFDLVGVNSYLWEFDHVLAHHDFPNVSGYDSNMYMYPAIRLDENTPAQWYHKYQHLYAPFIYAQATFAKVFIADFINFRRKSIGAIQIEVHPRAALFYLLVTKGISISYIYIIPLLVINAPVLQILLCMYLSHLLTGLALGLIFQVTHTNLLVTQSKPTENHEIMDSYERHIFKTTADFAIQNKWITWLTGGLNIHAVHHLLPRVSQMHLQGIAQIVKQTTQEHNIAYLEFSTWRAAIISHFKALKKLGVE